MKSVKQTAVLWFLFAVVAVSLYMWAFQPFRIRGESLGKAATGETAPDIELTALDGKKTMLSAFRGKVVFLNFWATWCAPCRAELSNLQELKLKMGDKPFAIVTVAVDEASPQFITDFLAERGVNIATYHDPRMEAAKKYGVTGFPETFLLDKQGKIVKKYIGPRVWTGRQMLDSFEELLRQS